MVPTTDPHRPRDLLTMDEAAKLLGVTPTTLTNWRKRGQGPRYIRFGTDSRVRYRTTALDDWLTAQETDPSATHDAR